LLSEEAAENNMARLISIFGVAAQKKKEAESALR
jgi:hypothetical protein